MIGDLLKTQFPEKVRDIDKAMNAFMKKGMGLLEMTEELKQIVGPQNYSQFINQHFSKLSKSFSTPPAIDTLKRDISKIDYVSFSQNYQEDPK